jgi:nucleoside diphosphate kinase
LAKNNFQIFHNVTKVLTKEEILNLFYSHRNASYYADIQEHLMTAESIVLLLTNSRDTIPAKVDGEDDIKLDNPVVRWKRMIGNKDPDDAKAQKFEET